MTVIVRGGCEDWIKWGSSCKGLSIMLDTKHSLNGEDNFGSMFLVQHLKKFWKAPYHWKLRELYVFPHLQFSGCPCFFRDKFWKDAVALFSDGFDLAICRISQYWNRTHSFPIAQKYRGTEFSFPQLSLLSQGPRVASFGPSAWWGIHWRIWWNLVRVMDSLTVKVPRGAQFCSLGAWGCKTNPMSLDLWRLEVEISCSGIKTEL